MIGIIADLHDHLVNFDEFVRQADSQLTELWIAGDVGTPETLASICERTTKQIFVVAGNVEEGHNLAAYEAVALRFSHLTWQSVAPLVRQTADKTTAMVHFPDQAYAYAAKYQPQTVLFGHSHRPDLKKLQATWLVNPGTLAGVFAPATYVLADADWATFRLERLYK